MTTLCYARNRLLAAIALGLLPALTWAQTTPEQLAQWLQQGQYERVLSEVDQTLRSTPDRADLTFYRGVALTELKRDDEALTVFRALNQTYPDSPEPLNNMGVLLARQGQYPAAIDALKSAIKADPQYAPAHENLGDVYARLSAQAYQTALKADPDPSGNVAPKLRLVSQIAPLSTASTPTTVAAKTPQQAPAPAPAQSNPTPAAKADLKADSPPAEATATALTPEQQQVQSAVRLWAEAWSHRDVSAYVASYTADYTPAGVSREQWLAQRKERIEGKSAIQVEVQDLTIHVYANKATTKFTQKYTANNHRSVDRKVLIWARQGTDWRIEQERLR